MSLRDKNDDFYVFSVLSTDNVEWIECEEGGKACYVNDKLHRWLTANGSKFYYLGGKLHRDNGPAIEHRTGRAEWFRNNVLFAIRYENGRFVRYMNSIWPEQPSNDVRPAGPTPR